MDTIKINPRFTCHTVNMLTEALGNPGMSIFTRPFQIFGRLLHDVSKRASQLDDPILNDLMCALTLYEIADPESPEYNFEAVEQIKKIAAEYAKYL